MLREINLKSEVIKGLIETSGFDKAEVAKKSKISLKSLEKGALTISQLKRLAEVLKRPIAAFFSDEIPPMPTVQDYRLNRDKRINPEVFFAQRKLMYLLEKLKEICIEKPSLPTFKQMISPFQLAKEFRDHLGIEVIKNQKPNSILSKYKETVEYRLKFLIIEYLKYLDKAMPNYDLVKLTVQTLAGTTLVGSRELISTTSDEKSLCERLLANWKSLIEENTLLKRG